MAASVTRLDLETFTSPYTPLSELIDWLQELDLLSSSMVCRRCPDMVDMELHRRADVTDKHAWRCPRCKTSRSLRTGSVFAKFPKITLRIWMRFLLKWCEDKLITEIQRELQTIGYVGSETLSRLCKHMRYLCELKLRDSPPIPMGGPGVILQMDESVFRKRPKYGRGRRPKEIWVFGLCRTDISPAIGFMTVVPNRKKETLLPIIQRCVLPNSTIHSDQWGAYLNVRNLPNVARHATVNHSMHFVDPHTGVNTQAIEAYWSRKKAKLRRMHGCYGYDTESYLKELMFRERYCRTSTHGLRNLLAFIAEKYPVD
ncbi:Hypp9504 [Branchiostoma lanceolatum]|uniref:Hypp9504 protein n=1 Tax=Branchiostoma lanceolatum TaxID=7740 RepID=A0A8S4MNV2_BRALA|nr:Hypp9504 [Branchiostoma lanceolatum]